VILPAMARQAGADRTFLGRSPSNRFLHETPRTRQPPRLRQRFDHEPSDQNPRLRPGPHSVVLAGWHESISNTPPPDLLPRRVGGIGCAMLSGRRHVSRAAFSVLLRTDMMGAKAEDAGRSFWHLARGAVPTRLDQRRAVGGVTTSGASARSIVPSRCWEEGRCVHRTRMSTRASMPTSARWLSCLLFFSQERTVHAGTRRAHRRWRRCCPPRPDAVLVHG